MKKIAMLLAAGALATSAHAITSDDGYFMGIDCYGPGSGCEMKLE